MIKKNIYLLLVILFSITLNAQTPCVGGMADGYPCDGYDLQGHLSLEDLNIFSDGNDCWGWTDPETGIEYAIMGGIDRTVFVDISTPTNPILVAWVKTASLTSIWRDIKVYNDHAFIVSEAAAHGMQVFDLSHLRTIENPPVEFDEDAHFTDFGSSHNIAINEETGYAYSIGGTTFDGGPHFINIQDPLNPITEGGYDADGYTHDAQIIIYDGPDVEHQCKEIFFGFNENSITIVDVTDKTDPIQISRTEYPSIGYTHQGWLSEDRTIAYMNDELDELQTNNNTRTLIMDISDLDNPVLIEEFFGETTAIDHNLYVKGDKLFEANYNSGLRVLQIGEESGNRLEEVGFFDINPSTNSANFNGSWSVYPYFESGNIIISGIDQGLFIVSSSTVIANDVDQPTVECATGIDEVLTSSFNMFPNPVRGEVSIELENHKAIDEVQIYDQVGRVVMNYTSKDNVHTIDLNVSSLASGVYLVKINGAVNGQQLVVE